MRTIRESLTALQHYIEKEEFRGYDPYDTLTSPLPFGIIGKWGNILAIQFQKRNPFNIRPLLGIKKQLNSKTVALLLEAYVQLAEKSTVDQYSKQLDFLFNDLKTNYAKGFKGYCWGYSFPWATSEKFLPANAPNIVATAYAVRALYSYWKVADANRKKEIAAIIQGAATFVMLDLPREESADGVFFSYTPFRKDCVYNASLFAAEVLSIATAIEQNKQYAQLASAAVEYVIRLQKEDGRWNYSKNLITGEERIQIDFHQGYILDSIFHIQKNLHVNDEQWTRSLIKGAHYYKTVQFDSDGKSKFRIPKEYPVDIHNQSQGIITFTKLSGLQPDYSSFANKIAEYTIGHMQAADGHFYYRIYPFYKNKISYMRWSNAEMLVALSLLQ